MWLINLFSHGLSYTTFEYSNLEIAQPSFSEKDLSLTASLTVVNTGNVAGSEIVQLYISMPTTSELSHPPLMLKTFAKVNMLQPGKSEKVELRLDKYAVSYWEERIARWTVEKGEYGIRIGSSSERLLLDGKFTLTQGFEWNGLWYVTLLYSSFGTFSVLLLVFQRFDCVLFKSLSPIAYANPNDSDMYHNLTTILPATLPCSMDLNMLYVGLVRYESKWSIFTYPLSSSQFFSSKWHLTWPLAAMSRASMASWRFLNKNWIMYAKGDKAKRTLPNGGSNNLQTLQQGNVIWKSNYHMDLSSTHFSHNGRDRYIQGSIRRHTYCD